MITQLTAKEIMNLPKDKTFWYSCISFREKTFRCSSIIKPAEIILKIDIDNLLYLRKVSDNSVIGSFQGYKERKDSECKFFVKLFDTEKECKEYYNAQIHNTVDRLQHFKENSKSLWYFMLEFSSKSYKCTRLVKPIEVLVTNWDEKSDYSLILKSKNKNLVFKNYHIRFFLPYLFETREECVEAYNAVVQDQKDKLQHDYEERLRYLNSKIEKL